MTDTPAISIVIPVLNEAEEIGNVLAALYEQEAIEAAEVIVVDGDAEGSTIRCIEREGIHTITSPKGRASQMNAGAEIAKREILLFLHADTFLPEGALVQIRRLMENEAYAAGAFDLGIDTDRWSLRLLAATASRRSRMTRIPYGDQATFIRREVFARLGGYASIPLMEDVDLMRRLKKNRLRIHIFKDKVMTSSRRWDVEGVLYCSLRNLTILTLYYCGVSPEKLARFYRNTRRKQ